MSENVLKNPKCKYCGAVVPQHVDPLFDVGVETHRGGLYGATTLSGVSNDDNLRVPPRSQDGLEGL